MNKCRQGVKEGFLEEAGVLSELASKDAQPVSKRKAVKDIPDRREKTGAQTYERAQGGQGAGSKAGGHTV